MFNIFGEKSGISPGTEYSHVHTADPITVTLT